MNHRPRLLVAAALAACLCLPAAAGAQVTTRDHRKPKGPPATPPGQVTKIPVRVDSLTPASGKPGIRVTLTGTGFTRHTAVLVGGKGARVVSWNAREIVFVVPPGLSDDAEVVLRGRAGADVPAGVFRVLVDPVIQRFAPVSGPPGTRVELIGRGFAKGDTLTLGGQPLKVLELAPGRILVSIPDGATTDFLHLARTSGPGAGARARSPRKFRVLATPPAISGFSPELGPPGSTVRLSGTGFTAKDRVYYGRATARIAGRGPGWVDVQVPPRTTRSEHFQVRGPGGVARSLRPFRLDLPPVVTRFAPRRGGPGTQIEVYGRHFRDGDWVALSGRRLPLVQIREGQISVTVPAGARSGPVEIGRGTFRTSARGTFEVIHPPTLTSFVPTRGEAGSRVTLTGTHLAGAKIFYGTRQLRVIEARGETALVVEVPAGAGDQVFRAVTRAGEAQTRGPFQVMEYALVRDARPRKATAGSTLTLIGTRLDSADRYTIGGKPLEVSGRSATSVTVKLPRGASSGPIEYVSHGRRMKTPFSIEVLATPVLAAFSPAAGPVGTKIIIRGANFDRSTEVRLGKLSLPVKKVSANEIIAVVPKGAGGREYLYLEGNGARVRSDQMFEVRVAPVINAASPEEGLPGTQVTVRGRWFTDGTEIQFGGTRARVIRRDGDSIVVEVPKNLAPGLVPLVARIGQLQTTARRPFRVVEAAPPKVRVRDHR